MAFLTACEFSESGCNILYHASPKYWECVKKGSQNFGYELYQARWKEQEKEPRDTYVCKCVHESICMHPVGHHPVM